MQEAAKRMELRKERAMKLSKNKNFIRLNKQLTSPKSAEIEFER